MTSIIKLEVISGAMDDSPLCYMLQVCCAVCITHACIFQVDQYHFLLDCGWDERFDMAYMETLRRRVPHIDAVLLSYADIAHLGALPYLVGKCGLDCPIYATVCYQCALRVHVLAGARLQNGSNVPVRLVLFTSKCRRL